MQPSLCAVPTRMVCAAGAQRKRLKTFYGITEWSVAAVFSDDREDIFG